MDKRNEKIMINEKHYKNEENEMKNSTKKLAKIFGRLCGLSIVGIFIAMILLIWHVEYSFEILGTFVILVIALKIFKSAADMLDKEIK